MKLNKKAFVEDYVGIFGGTKVEAKEQLERFLHILTNALETCRDIQLTGYFSTKTTFVPSRMGRNPQTGEEIEIPAHMRLSMKPGTKFKKAVK